MPKISVPIAQIDSDFRTQLEYALTFVSEDILSYKINIVDSTIEAEVSSAAAREPVSRKIQELGRELDIPTVENVPLARALYRSVDIEQEIPIELYKAVAEVLADVYKVRKRTQ